MAYPTIFVQLYINNYCGLHSVEDVAQANARGYCAVLLRRSKRRTDLVELICGTPAVNCPYLTVQSLQGSAL